MKKMFINVTMLFIASGCQNTEETNPPVNINEEDNNLLEFEPEITNENEGENNLLGSATEGDFQVDVYQSEENPNTFRAEFSYVGEEEQIEIYHYSRIMNFALEQNGESVLGVPFSLDEQVSSELIRGEPLEESVYSDSFEQDSPDPDQEYTLTVEPYYYLEDEEPREPINLPYIEVNVRFTN